MTNSQIHDYLNEVGKLASNTTANGSSKENFPLVDAFARVNSTVLDTHDSDGTVMFVGNGGSASIASHMAIDFSKCGGVRSICFNDGSSLTCLGNDLGYENVFAHQIKQHGRAGSLLIAISSSGESPNILKAVEAARATSCKVITFSGFAPDNALRSCGEVNFHVASKAYGFVEIIHLTLLHAILDLRDGWPKPVWAENDATK